MKILKLSFWYDAGGMCLRPMPSVCEYNDIEKWFEKEIQAGITHRINVPEDDIAWPQFFEKYEIIDKDAMLYKLEEERFALFILTYY